MIAPLGVAGVAEFLAGATHTQASIFMLHRFACPELGIAGHAPEMLRAALSHLRKQRYNLISLQEIFRRLREGEPLTRAVAFTIDDGYFDHAEVAGPIFVEFDCPVTIFAVSGFLDGQIWLWWDKLQYICEKTTVTNLKVRVGDEQRWYKLTSAEERRAATLEINGWCQDASEADRIACIARLPHDAGVELPVAPPPQFAPLTWDEARQLEKCGITFGPHTVTHPVLSSTSAEHAQSEIATSWERLQQELASPVPIFCYPHGRERDFGTREIATVERLGLWGAVRGYPGRFRPEDFRRTPSICRVPRHPFSDDLTDILQCVSGLEGVKARLRGDPAWAAS